ncbi:hypothetical protein Trydic_g422 [Trypoxylus dichotomus]
MTVLKLIKILLLLLYVTCESCEAYHRYGDLKSDHQHKRSSVWSNKLYGSNSVSSSPATSSWYRSSHHHHQHNRHGITTTTSTSTSPPHHIRHSGYASRYPKLDGVMHRLNPSKKSQPDEDANVRDQKSSNSNERHLWDNSYGENDYDEDDVLESVEGKEEDITEDDDKWVSEI